MTDEYQEMLKRKRIASIVAGFGIDESSVNPKLYDFQRAIAVWALRRGKAAIFADCGLGKTPIQLEWATQVCMHTGGNALIVAPLAVAQQTVREGQKFDIDVRWTRSQEDCGQGISITNYEMLHKFDSNHFSAIVLDESSILKSYAGKYRQWLTEFAEPIAFRLCCTATPAPNDITEIVNHSEFLGILSGKEILALFFRLDGNTTHKWRIKGHAEEEFWKWMASWAVALRSPADLGFNDAHFILPGLNRHEHTVEGQPPTGYLFAVTAQTLQERREARKASLPERVKRAAELVAMEPDEQWLIWCDLNAESDALTRAIEGAVEVKGSDSIEHKSASMLSFGAGELRVLVTKPTIAGFGMNWQNCARMIFVGLSDSYEQQYQATRRCWRFGQKRPVQVHIVIGNQEGAVKDNVERKERHAAEMFSNMLEHMNLYQLDSATRQEMAVEYEEANGDEWKMYLGDSFYLLDEVEDDSIGLSVFSPPFPGMYAYTNSAADLGNSRNIEEMVEHFSAMSEKLLRVLMPGRHCCIHLTQIPAFKWIDGYIGLKDFRGAVISMMQSQGWIFYGEVTIDKDPQVKAIRTKDRGLLFKTLATDASHLHPALADYMLQFRKPGENLEPIKAGVSEKYGNPDGWITAEEWIKWAAPVWYDRRETNVLNVRDSKDARDEKHLCPLQLWVIERAVKLWSNPGDVVLSPFAGIGSEGVGALRWDREFIGMELKRSYFEVACKNIEATAKSGRVQGRFQFEAGE